MEIKSLLKPTPWLIIQIQVSFDILGTDCLDYTFDEISSL